MKNKSSILLGAHMSIAGGVAKAITRGESIHSTCIQIFTASNRQWSHKVFEQQEVDEYKTALSKSSIQLVCSHASYLINLGSPKEETQKKSIDALIAELNRCAQLEIPYVVLHPGSSLKSDPEECIKRVAQNLDVALSKSSGCTQILLENMAGQGTAVAYTFEQLAKIYEQTNQKDKIGICFDTAHAFVAGYDLRNPESYNEVWEQFDAILGIDLLKIIHINDSKKELGTRVDRHEHIGQGFIGSQAFALIMNDKRLIHVPKILETPKDDDLEQDRTNLKKLIELTQHPIQKTSPLYHYCK